MKDHHHHHHHHHLISIPLPFSDHPSSLILCDQTQRIRGRERKPNKEKVHQTKGLLLEPSGGGRRKEEKRERRRAERDSSSNIINGVNDGLFDRKSEFCHVGGIGDVKIRVRLRVGIERDGAMGTSGLSSVIKLDVGDGKESNALRADPDEETRSVCTLVLGPHSSFCLLSCGDVGVEPSFGLDRS